MLGRHERLEPVALGERGGARRRHPVEQPEGLRDLVVVPPRAVLVGQEDEVAVRPDSGVTTGVLQEEQREQGPQGGLLGPQGEGDPHEPDRLAGQVGPQEVGAGARCVAGGEREVGDLRDDLEPFGQHRGVGHAEGDAGGDDLALPPRDPRGHRRNRHEEEPRDVVGGHTDDEAQGERTRHLGRERRVAAHEDEAQHVVVDEVAGVGHGSSSVGDGLRVDDEQGLLAQRDGLGPQPVDDPAPSGRHEPGGRALGGPVARPCAGGRLHGIREGVLDEVEPSELREEEGDEPPPLRAHGCCEDVVRCHGGS